MPEKKRKTKKGYHRTSINITFYHCFQTIHLECSLNYFVWSHRPFVVLYISHFKAKHYICTYQILCGAKQDHIDLRVWRPCPINVSLPYTPLDNIRVMVIVWRLRRNIIRTAPCWIVWHNVHVSSTLIWAVLQGPADWVCHIGTLTPCIEAVA